MAFEVRLADIGEGLTEAELVSWLVEPGAQVEANQPLLEVETDKAVVEIPAPRNGVLLHQGAAPGEVVPVGGLLAVIGDEGETWEPAAEPAAEPAPAPAAGDDRPRAVPLVRKLAAELGVDLATVRGTGRAGQITREDVIAAAQEPAGEPMSKLRRTIAEHMARSWAEIPHVTVWGPADATRLLAARQETGWRLETLLVLAVLPALDAHGDFSARFDGATLRRASRHDVGVAVDTAAGLLVPVVRDAGERSPEDLDEEITRLVEGARARTLPPEDLRDPSFTITNVGAVGGGYGTPIIPHGSTAILSVGRARDEVVARDGRPVVVPVFPLALSFDHRVIDGAAGAAFLNRVTEQIEGFRP